MLTVNIITSKRVLEVSDGVRTVYVSLDTGKRVKVNNGGGITVDANGMKHDGETGQFTGDGGNIPSRQVERKKDTKPPLNLKKNFVLVEINGKIKKIRQVVLEKKEYTRVMHEVLTNATDEQRSDGRFWKAIDGFLYWFMYDPQNNDYFIMDKKYND